ncbi:hypothetical protein IGI04_026444 [Brassica rapa subsp. trilocularis]|uniref:Uncharacterized protein n=1 Tax=Brassica rapa subsp. trilocularis TaxID=1813537 RepID=A0ABQ7KWD2_BRACM|nr:hypothetical protein IGI04_026444 [Brassica rapa subsp. trilocularis]
MSTLIRNLLVMFNEHADVNYIGGQGNYHNMGFNQKFENHQNLLCYRSNNMKNPKDQIYPPMGKSDYNQFQSKRI